MQNKPVLIIACFLLTGLLWFAFERTHPVFVAEEAMAAGKKAGGLTEEWIADIRREDLKSYMLTYGIWGAFLAGFAGFTCNSRGKKRILGLVSGIVLGALGGAAGAYVAQWHDLSTEYTGAGSDFWGSTYWIVRWAMLYAPMALAAALAAALSGNFGKDLADSIAGSLIGSVIAITITSVLIGVITPVEGHQYIYPSFSASRVLALGSINISVALLIIMQLSRKVADAASAGGQQTSSAGE